MAPTKPSKQDKVIEAIALKPPEETWTQLGERFGCTEANIRYYRRRYADEILAEARQNLAADIPQIYQAIADQAKTGNIQAAKLILEHLGMMEAKAPKAMDHEAVLRIVAEFSAKDERVRQMVEIIQREKREERAQRQSVPSPPSGALQEGPVSPPSGPSKNFSSKGKG